MENKTSIALTKETKDELDKLKRHPRATYDEVLKDLASQNAELLKRVQKLEEILAFSGVSADADARKREIVEQKASREAGERERLKIKGEKEAKVKEILEHPPQCHCDATMVPIEPVPFFIVGDWFTKSADPMTWGIVFECPKSTKLDQHGRVTIYPDLQTQRTPRSKRSKSLSDGYLVATG